MASKKKKKATKKGGGAKRGLSPVLANILGEAGKKFGNGRYMGKNADAQYFGIPIPCLALQWVIKNTCLPIGKMIGLAGKPKSHKSSLGFEFARWVMNHQGYTHLVENESGKYDAKVMRSIMGDKHFDSNFLISEATDASNAQEILTKSAFAVRANKKRDELWMFMLDSLSGTEVRESWDKVRKEGSAGRDFPVTTMSWTRYLKNFTSYINTYPAIFLSVNHLKEKPSTVPGGQPQKHTPGGVAQEFHCELFFWISFLKEEQRATWEINGETVTRPTTVRRVQIECHRSSVGPERRRIPVDFCFYDGLDGKPYAYVDWDAATARWLYDQQSTWGVVKNEKAAEGEPEGDYQRLRAILPIDVESGRFTCDLLELDGVEAHTLGRAVHNKHWLMEKLTDFFAIKRNDIWSGALPVPEFEPLLPEHEVLPTRDPADYGGEDTAPGDLHDGG